MDKERILIVEDEETILWEGPMVAYGGKALWWEWKGLWWDTQIL